MLLSKSLFFLGISTLLVTACPGSALAVDKSESGAMPFACGPYLEKRELQSNVRLYAREPNNQIAFYNAAYYYLAVKDFVKAANWLTSLRQSSGALQS
ncbi:hypothetical protein BH11CYA1_BH11CYA1_33170 [soil metagenome]